MTTARLQDTSPQAVSDTINDAADLLEKGGWTRGSFKKDTSHCSVGALLAVNMADHVDLLRIAAEAYHPNIEAAAISVLNAAGHHTVPHDGAQYMLISWNDGQAQNRQQVLDVFRKAAKQVITNSQEEGTA